jgi:hypothetical protein
MTNSLWDLMIALLYYFIILWSKYNACQQGIGLGMHVAIYTVELYYYWSTWAGAQILFLAYRQP